MITINFVGDIALFKEYQIMQTDPVKEVFLPESNYNIGNFEFIIPNKRNKFFFDVQDQYAVDYSYLESLSLNRFNAFGMANNHCMDYGKEGIEDVMNVFNKKNICSFGVGHDDFNILKFQLDGISFAILAVVKPGRWSRNSELPFGPDPYDMDKLIEIIKTLKHEVCHVVIFPHFGTELVDIPDPLDVINSRLLIDNGATAVIGHHPHIIQGIEHYKDGIIAYSLGSFIYILQNEEGYTDKQNKNREYSICLNLTFDKSKITGINPVYYRYDVNRKIPARLNAREPYFDEVDNLIHNHKAYYTRIRRELLSREINLFYQRLKRNPIKTIKHYLGYIKLQHIKKLFS